jgi:hypothetical protein
VELEEVEEGSLGGTPTPVGKRQQDYVRDKRKRKVWGAGVGSCAAWVVAGMQGLGEIGLTAGAAAGWGFALGWRLHAAGCSLQCWRGACQLTPW